MDLPETRRREPFASAAAVEGEEERGLAAVDAQEQRAVAGGAGAAHGAHELVDGADGLAVDLDDDVAGFEAAGGGALGIDLLDDDAGLAELERLGACRGAD